MKTDIRLLLVKKRLIQWRTSYIIPIPEAKTG